MAPALHSILGLDQLELHGHVDGLGQQLLHPFPAQQLAELDQGGGVAGAVVFKVRLAREEPPGRCFASALDDTFVGLVEGVFEVRQRDHDSQRHARPSGVAGNGDSCTRSPKRSVGHGQANTANG